MKLLTDFTHLKVPISTPIPFLYSFISIKIFLWVSLPFGDKWKKSLKPGYSEMELPFYFQYLPGLVRGDVPYLLQKQTVLKCHFWLKVGVGEIMWNLEGIFANQCNLLILQGKIWLSRATDKGKTCPCYSSTKRSFSMFSLCISYCHCCF